MNEYTEEWKSGAIQQQVRERAEHRCEECGMEFEEGTNLAKERKQLDGTPIIGTVHHIDHNRSNDAPNNLVFLCQCCHIRLHGKNWKPGSPLLLCWHGKPPRWITDRRIPYRIAQPLLFDIE